MDEGVRRVCALHPDRPASITCKHCGSYACSQCTVDTLWGETLCTACEARGAAQYPIPWDRAMSPGTFIATTRNLFSELNLVFRAFPQGSFARAFGYACLMGILLIVAIVVAGAMNAQARGVRSSLPWEITVFAILHVVGTLAAGATFYLMQTMLRGRASLGMCMRASCYLTALDTLFVAAMFMPGVLGWAVFVGGTSMWLWSWVVLGESRAGLSRRGAVLSAIAVLIGSAIAAMVPAVLLAAVLEAVSGRLR